MARPVQHFRARLEEWYRDIEKFRIRQHLQRTEEALRSKDVSHLPSEKRERRQDMLDALNRYWNRGEFPDNDRFLRRKPFFVGPRGTLCAVGHLMAEDGREGLVGSISEEDNFVYVEDLDGGPAADWIEGSGLTREEAARIQPAYGTTSAVLTTTCGPVTCSTAALALGAMGTAAFAGLEWLGYRLFGEIYPHNALKRRGSYALYTSLNLVLVAAGLFVAYALLP